jgi:hypothetical protein
MPRPRDTFRAIALALALPVAFAACKDKAPDAPPAAPAAHEHPAAPHGGEIVELGDEVAHLEIVHDATAGSLTIYALAADVSTPLAIEKPTVNLAGKGGPVQIPLNATKTGADGKADVWSATHPALETDPLDGRVRVTIDGKTYNPSLEPEGHSHH